MAEIPETGPLPLPSNSAEVPLPVELDEPLPKRRKEASDKLEDRLGGILCCSVCLDLPQAAVYQCINGHLMCELCFTHLLADASLRREGATCPNCRIEISKTSASRNLAVEKTVSELPSECKYCTHMFPKNTLQHHEKNICEDRPYKFSQIVVEKAKPSFPCDMVRIAYTIQAFLLGVLRRTFFVSTPAPAHPKRRAFRRVTGCRYAIIGCQWQGAARDVTAHEDTCAYPTKPAADIIEVLQEREKQAKEANLVNKHVFELLSYEYITFTNLQLKPYRTSEQNLYYESSRFSAFSQQWVVKAFVNTNQRDPTQSAQREISYQLILKSDTLYPLNVNWMVLREPHGDLRLRIEVHSHTFTEERAEAPRTPLPLRDINDANRLLSNKAIHFRLIMFQA